MTGLLSSSYFIIVTPMAISAIFYFIIFILLRFVIFSNDIMFIIEQFDYFLLHIFQIANDLYHFYVFISLSQFLFLSLQFFILL